MVDTISVPIAANATFDGGPYENFEGYGTSDGHTAIDGQIAGRTSDGHEWAISIDTLEDTLANEIRTHEPIHLNTGDTDGYTVGVIELPCLDGYHIRIHRHPGQGIDREAMIVNLNQDEDRRRHFEEQLKIHGGSIEG